MDDGLILKDARRGNEGAFLNLYERYRTPVFRFAWRLTASVEAAEDVTQECFLALLEGAAFDERRGPLRTYLFGIARNLAMKHVRLSTRESDEVENSPGRPIRSTNCSRRSAANWWAARWRRSPPCRRKR